MASFYFIFGFPAPTETLSSRAVWNRGKHRRHGVRRRAARLSDQNLDGSQFWREYHTMGILSHGLDL